MTGIFQTLLTGIVLGFSIAAPPGPVNALSAQQVVSRSWLSGWLVLLGATTADAIFFVLTFFGVITFLSQAVRSFLFIVGGVLMLYLTIVTIAKARRREEIYSPKRDRLSASPHRPSFVLGLTMGLTNPFQLGWWIAIGAGTVAEFGASIAGGFFIGILCWTLVFSAIIHEGVNRYERIAPFVAYASAIIMAGFGFWFLVQGLLAVLS